MKEELVAIDHSTLNIELSSLSIELSSLTVDHSSDAPANGTLNILPMCQPMVNRQWSMVNVKWSMANASSVSDDFSAKGSESYAG